MEKDIKSGDRIEFVGSSRKRTGTVIKVFWSRSRKRPPHLKLKVTEDCDAKRVWTLPVRYATVIPGEGRDLAEARKVNNDIKSHNATIRCNKITRNMDAFEEAGLLGRIDMGDRIDVKFKQGWQTVFYAGIVKSSGNIRFIDRYNNKRTTAAIHVRAHCPVLDK